MRVASIRRALISKALLVRRLRFAALNLAGLLLVVAIMIIPFVSHIASEYDDISASAEQLARLKVLIRPAGVVGEISGQLDGAFFASSEERLASADLHATLKAFSQERGLQLLGLRSVTPRQPIASRVIAVGVELEGSPGGLRDTLQRIEAARPMLVVTALVLRPSSAGDNVPLRAEFTIQGALHPGPTRAAGLGP
jgi:Type II secretion system (T2SS), protein M subtype b